MYRVHGKEHGAFLTRYNTMRRDGVHRTIDASPVGAAVLAYLEQVPSGWEGTLSDLMDRLDRFRPHSEAWPRSAKGLGDALRRLAPALRLIGFECKSDGKAGGVIRWRVFPSSKTSKPSPASPASPGQSGSVGAQTGVSTEQTGHAGHSGHGSESFGAGKKVLPIEEVL